VDGVIMEKPLDNKRAFEMLQKCLLQSYICLVHHVHHRLSGKTHLVHTGVSLVRKMASGIEQHCFHEQTHVTFGELKDEVITAYVESGEPL